MFIARVIEYDVWGRDINELSLDTVFDGKSLCLKCIERLKQ